MNKEELDELRGLVVQAHEQLQRADFAGARLTLERVAASERSSPFVWFQLSTTAEQLDDVEEAFEFARRAVAIDPMHPMYGERLVEAAGALRQHLEDEAADLDLEGRRRVYDTLLRAGEATVGSHLAMAAVHLAAGALDDAWKLVEATALLEPSNAAGWRARAEVASQRGDVEAAAESRARADALEAAPAPWGIPTPPAEC